MISKRWTLLQAPSEKVNALQQELRIHKAICQILVQRGFDHFDSCRNFFRPQLNALHNPWLMKDMDRAVNRIQSAFEKKEKILVFGDYDVDGTTSVACMYQFLLQLHPNELLDFYIPHRYREGYGVSKAGIDFAHQNNFSLIISLDCGIKSVDLVAYAASLGIDFIICDHHLPDEQLPAAVAILNPKQTDCTYPYKDLCGCGVGFKLMTALAETFQLPEEARHQYLDLLAIAIAADIVPMTGENRILAYYGLQRINQQPSPGIQALIHLGKLDKALSITHVVFVIAPRINAAGRMDDARKAVLLFIEKDPEQAADLAKQLHLDNSDRKEADLQTTEEALSIIRQNEVSIQRKSTVVYHEEWHKGVVGIVASRLIERYYRPTVVLTRSGDLAAGSARSVAGFNLYEAIHACREHLIGYGGHFAAAGLTLLPEKVGDFSRKFEEVVAATIQPESLVPEIVIDAQIDFTAITPTFYSIIHQMEPFGPDNLRPVFLSTQIKDTGQSKVVKEAHLRLVVTDGTHTLTGIGFNMAEKYQYLSNGAPVDLVYTIDENIWNGQTSLQLKIIDLLPAGSSFCNR